MIRNMIQSNHDEVYQSKTMIKICQKYSQWREIWDASYRLPNSPTQYLEVTRITPLLNKLSLVKSGWEGVTKRSIFKGIFLCQNTRLSSAMICWLVDCCRKLQVLLTMSFFKKFKFWEPPVVNINLQ